MIFKRKNVWYYDFVIDGKRYRASTGETEKSKAQAVEEKLRVQYREKHSVELVWEQTKRQLMASTDLSFDFDAIWDAFIKVGHSEAGAQRLRLYAARLKEFCDWMKANHSDVTTCSKVLPIHATEWWNSIRQGDGSNSTKNDKLVALKLIFSSLGKEYGIVESPFAAIKKLATDQISKEAFTPKELELIGKNATGWVYSLCLTALSTGLREGDICMLRRDSVDLESGWIRIARTRKTGVAVEIPILPGLRKHLEERLADEVESDYVFPELAEQYQKNAYYIGKGIKSFFNEIGITGATKAVDGYKRQLSNKDVHSFRHTFVYLAACHGIPFPVVQGIVGHMNADMTKHYMDHAGRDAKVQYMSQLPDYLTIGRSAPALPTKKSAPTVPPLERAKQILANMTASTWMQDRDLLLTLL